MALEIIKSTDTLGIANRKAGKDVMEGVLFQVCHPLCIAGSDFEFHREKDGAEHIRGRLWMRVEVRITISHDEIRFGKVKAPELLYDFSDVSR